MNNKCYLLNNNKNNIFDNIHILKLKKFVQILENTAKIRSNPLFSISDMKRIIKVINFIIYINYLNFIIALMLLSVY